MQITSYINLNLKNEEAGLEELLSKESSFPIPPTLLQEDPQSNPPILLSSFRALQEELVWIIHLLLIQMNSIFIKCFSSFFTPSWHLSNLFLNWTFWHTGAI